MKQVTGAKIDFRSPFADKDRLMLKGNKYAVLKQYLQWWKRYGFDKTHARNNIIEVTWYVSRTIV
jgi:hypothetical protein